MKPHLFYAQGLWVCAVGQVGAVGDTWQEALINYLEYYWEDHIGAYLWEN